jgi:hypothetical protein
VGKIMQFIVMASTEIFLALFAFFLGIYTEHIKDIAGGLSESPNNWRSIMNGMLASNSYYPFIILFLICGFIVLLNLWMYKKQKDVEKENINRIVLNTTTQVLTQITKVLDQKHSELRDDLLNIIRLNNAELTQAINKQTEAILAAIQNQNRGGQNEQPKHPEVK